MDTPKNLGQPEEQHFALCFEGVTGLTKKCYGTYIDKEYINKVLGNRTITILAGACAATLLACEAMRGLIAGAVLGTIGSRCGLRHTRSHSCSNPRNNRREVGAVGRVRHRITYNIRGTLRSRWCSCSRHSRSYTAYKFNFEYAKKAAEYLLSTKTETGKLAKVKSGFGKITTKGASTRVNRYFNALFGEFEELKNLDVLQKARIIAAAEKPDDLAKIYAALILAENEEKIDLIKRLTFTHEVDRIKELLTVHKQGGEETTGTLIEFLRSKGGKIEELREKAKTLGKFKSELDSRLKYKGLRGRYKEWRLNVEGLGEDVLQRIEKSLSEVEGIVDVGREGNGSESS